MGSYVSVTAEGVSPPSGPFSPATLATGTSLLSVSGQIAQDAAGALVGAGDAEEQARQCLRNLDDLLRAAGTTKGDVVRIVVYLTDMADRAGVARAREEYFGEHRPASTLVQVSALVAPELLVEIEATAVF
jgi:enamine deaminase RidA (YjgF/YER057c/UK114 family)